MSTVIYTPAQLREIADNSGAAAQQIYEALMPVFHQAAQGGQYSIAFPSTPSDAIKEQVKTILEAALFTVVGDAGAYTSISFEQDNIQT